MRGSRAASAAGAEKGEGLQQGPQETQGKGTLGAPFPPAPPVEAARHLTPRPPSRSGKGVRVQENLQNCCCLFESSPPSRFGKGAGGLGGFPGWRRALTIRSVEVSDIAKWLDRPIPC